MLDDAPHILNVCTERHMEKDEYGKPIKGSGGLTCVGLTECFCHDNSQMKQVSVNGELWTYNYHIVYEGEKIALGTKVTCTDKETGRIVGEGTVKKNAECYSSELKGRCDLWL